VEQRPVVIVILRIDLRISPRVRQAQSTNGTKAAVEVAVMSLVEHVLAKVGRLNEASDWKDHIHRLKRADDVLILPIYDPYDERARRSVANDSGDWLARYNVASVLRQDDPNGVRPAIVLQ
jgi:hypothetical protein